MDICYKYSVSLVIAMDICYKYSVSLVIDIAVVVSMIHSLYETGREGVDKRTTHQIVPERAFLTLNATLVGVG